MFAISGPEPIEYHVGMLLLALLVSVAIGKRLGTLAGITFAWIAFTALRIFTAPFLPFPGQDAIWNSSLELSAASAFAGVCLTIYAAQFFRKETWIKLFRIFVFCNALTIPFYYKGLLLNESMGGCLVACSIPLFLSKDFKMPWWEAAILGASIFASLKNQPIALLFLVVGVFLIAKKKWAILFCAFASSLLAGWIVVGSHFGKFHGRIEVWKDAYEFFKANFHPLVGAGLGTFYYIGPFLTIKKYGEAFIWLHSDWLQIGFESGLIGMVLLFALYVQACFRARGDTRLLASLIGFGAFGIANFPLHNIISALFGACLMWWALERKAVCA